MRAASVLRPALHVRTNLPSAWGGAVCGFATKFADE